MYNENLSFLLVFIFCYNHLKIIFFLPRLRLEERRKELLQKLEETTKLTTYLHSQLKRWAYQIFEGKAFSPNTFRHVLVHLWLLFTLVPTTLNKIIIVVQLLFEWSDLKSHFLLHEPSVIFGIHLKYVIERRYVLAVSTLRKITHFSHCPIF